MCQVEKNQQIPHYGLISYAAWTQECKREESVWTSGTKGVLVLPQSESKDALEKIKQRWLEKVGKEETVCGLLVGPKGPDMNQWSQLGLTKIIHVLVYSSTDV